MPREIIELTVTFKELTHNYKVSMNDVSEMFVVNSYRPKEYDIVIKFSSSEQLTYEGLKRSDFDYVIKEE